MKMFNMKDGLEKQAKNLGKFDARVRENIRFRLKGKRRKIGRKIIFH
jgi:hypothetical protein